MGYERRSEGGNDEKERKKREKEKKKREICFFFFNDTATTEIYTLSLHDALPIYFKKISHNLFSSMYYFRKKLVDKYSKYKN